MFRPLSLMARRSHDGACGKLRFALACLLSAISEDKNKKN